jgi:hypothetical protein
MTRKIKKFLFVIELFFFFFQLFKRTLHLKQGGRVQLGQLIGLDYGAHYAVNDGQLKALSFAEVDDVFQLFGLERNADDADNRNMAQDGSAQTLDADSIQQLKTSRVDGREIVGELVGNSKTFATRTAFSQQKYLAKKKRKYVPMIQILRPTARTIAHALYASDPKAIAYLRIDTLAQLLAAANIQAESVPVIIGDYSGIVCGAVFERLAETGRLLVLRCKDGRVPFSLLKHFDKSFRERIDVLALGSAQAREWCEARGGATSLIVVGNFDPRETLMTAMALMAPCANFAVHSRFQEPLADCYWRMYRGTMACNMQISSSFYRVHQVLPNRTHPLMQMDGAGGYVLTGTSLAGGFDPDVINDEIERKKQAAAEASTAAATTAATTAVTTAVTTAAVVEPIATDDNDAADERPEKRARVGEVGDDETREQTE